MKRITHPQRKFLLTLLLCGAGILAFGLNWRAGAAAQDGPLGQASPDGIWQGKGFRSSASVNGQAQSFQLNQAALTRALSRAPYEYTAPLSASSAIISLPLPDGTFGRFQIEESPAMEPALAAKFPDIKSYRAQGLDDRTAIARCDHSPEGFHAYILGAKGAISIRPVEGQNTGVYLSVGSKAEAGQAFCGVRVTNLDGRQGAPAPAVAIGPIRKNYRMAIATTGEYTANYGGTVPAALASVNTWVNGANVVFERDLGAHFNLVANNDQIIFTNAATDGLTNGDENTMINEIQPILDNLIGNANYDIGHVLGLHNLAGASAGVAQTPAVCNNTDKGQGATRMSGVAGNASAQGVLTHEFGHQFSANHSFNGSVAIPDVAFCDARNPATSWESGSGSTMMSYAGICQNDNISFNRDARFHSGSYGEVQTYLASPVGGSCGVPVNTGNTAPTLNGGGNFTIPQRTPFTLTANGGDPDAGDVANLTYTWEQLDAGGNNFPQDGTAASYTDENDPPNTTRPIFRAFPATTSPARTFPSLTYILNNANVPPDLVNGFQSAEQLPRVNRTLNFRATVRDNRGGVNEANAVITVAPNAGPFNVTAPNGGENLTGGAATNVTWDVAGTNAAPINVANVKISLSTDGGNTFPIVLAANTPNDGTQSITFPNSVLSTTARVKIEAVGNIFFDISDANFNLTPGDGCPAVNSLSPGVASVGTQVVLTGINFNGVTAVNFTGANVNCPSANCTVNSNTQITLTVPAGATTGTLTVVKPGCNNLTTPNLLVCPNPSVSLQVDDGTLDFIGTAGGAGQTSFYVNRLTPAAYPATLSRVSIYFSNAQALPVGTAINILVGTNPAGGNIDDVSFQTIAATVMTQNAFNVYTVAPVTINAGDFVVGYSIVNVAGVFSASFDDTLLANRSYSKAGTGTFSLYPDRNLLIRAQVFTGNCAGAAPACPTVGNIAPTNGAVGSQVVITGTNFTGVNGVKFSNNVVANFTVDSATQITATVPVGAVTGPITISKTGCNDVQTATFTVNAACPTVGNIAPTNGAVGAQVVITGTNFTGVTGVKFSNNVNATFNVNSATQITATVPVGAVTGPITISKTGCNDVQTATFTVNAGCPAITITPANLTAGTVNTAYNQALTATGGAAPYAFALDGGNGGTSRFDVTGAVNIPDNNPAGIDVPINVTGINAPLTKVTVALYLTHTYDEDLTLQLIGPDATTVNLSVKRGGNGDNYGAACAPDAQRTTFDDAAATLITAGAPPFVGSFRPEQVLTAFNGKAGAAVNGQWKLHVVDDSEVDTGAIQCVSLFLTTAAAPAPGLALATNGTLSGTPTTAGTFNFTVKATDANGCMGTKAYALTINAAAACPTVTGFNPTNGVVGSQVIITGTNFTGVTGVKFSNNVTATFTVNSATQIAVTIPAGAVTGPITISKTGCTDVQTASFTVCTGATRFLQVDNGAYNGSDTVLDQNPQTYFVNRLTPTSYPATLSQVLLRFDFVQAGEPITIVVAPNPTGSTTLNNLAFQTVNITAPGGAGFGDPVLVDAYSVPAITINSGDFVVGFGLASNTAGNGSPMAADNNIPAQSRSYKSGSLTAFGQPVDKNYFIRARYLTGCAGGCPAITVLPTDPTLTAGTVNTAYNQLFLQQGGAGAVNFSLSAGTLPPGLNLATSGLLNGTPTAAGTFNFTVRATDANQCTGERAYTLTINAVGGNGLQFFPLAAPVRLLDTRAGAAACTQPNAPVAGQTSLTQVGRNFCGIPANAVALTGNISTINSGGGFLTLYPSDAAQPTVANSTYGVNEVINNVFTVGLGAGDGAFKIFAFNTTDVAVDVTGYYAPPATGGLYFHPLPAPVRLLDTRANATGCVTPGTPLAGNADSTQQAITPCTGIPAAARALVGNATTISPQGFGYLTLFPGDAPRPLAASSTYGPGQTVNGPFTVGLAANGQFKIYTFAATDLAVDIVGYYSTEANDANGAGLLFTPLPKPVRLLETRNLPTGCFKPNAPLNGQQEYTQVAQGTCDGVTIPANARGIVGNATAVTPNGFGFLTLWPSGATRPLVATATYSPGEVTNRHFIVGLGAGDGAFKMYTFATSHLVIDLAGYFAP